MAVLGAFLSRGGIAHMPNNLDTPRTISIQARLDNLGRRLGILANIPQVMRYFYFHDGFLARLARSPYQQHFVLGGALLLLKFVHGLTQARPTQDADFTCLGLPPDQTSLGAVLQTIVQVPWGDEVVFDAGAIRMQQILQQGTTQGLRARIPARLGNAREVLPLDLAFGTMLIGGPQLRQVPTTLDPSVTIPIYTYPLETVMGGKVAGMLLHGAANTRFKDYYDLHALARTQDWDGSALQAALAATCHSQGLVPDPTSVVFASPAFLTDPQQLQGWGRFLSSNGLAARAPSFAEAITIVRQLYGPVLSGTAGGLSWDHTAQRWR
jgi:hypothetical protein